MFLKKQARRGFTLTEIAIVLGIMGLILGAIWVAAAAVYTNMRVNTGAREILALLQGTRSVYSTSSLTGEVGNPVEITTQLVNAGVFTKEMLAGAITVNPWNVGAVANTIKVWSSHLSADGDAITVTFLALPQAACIALFTALAGNNADPGLAFVNNAGTGAVGAKAPPVSATWANTTGCAAGNANVVDFTFKLKG